MSVVLTHCGDSVKCHCDCHRGDCMAIHIAACCHKCTKCGEENIVYCTKEHEPRDDDEIHIES
jgi:hypothetical protein